MLDGNNVEIITVAMSKTVNFEALSISFENDVISSIPLMLKEGRKTIASSVTQDVGKLMDFSGIFINSTPRE